MNKFLYQFLRHNVQKNNFPFMVFTSFCNKNVRSKSDCSKGSNKTKKKLVKSLSSPIKSSKNKISVIGCGSVGMACVVSILIQNVASELVMIDADTCRLEGEKLDLQHGAIFLRDAKIRAGDDYCLTAGSKICVVTAGVRQKEGESRLNLVQRNTDIFKVMIPELVKYSPDTIFLIVSNPVDIMTYVTWKYSRFPKNRVLGSGTSLDSARFRLLIGQRLGIAPTSCHGWIIGEHGDSSVPVWSGVNIAGVKLREINPTVGTSCDKENWNKIHKNVVQSAYDIIRMKGYTNWAIGLCVSDVCRAITRNLGSVHPVSTYVKGVHNIKKEVFLSLPCVLGEQGVTHIVKQPLEKDELDKFRKSVGIMDKVQKGLKM